MVGEVEEVYIVCIAMLLWHSSYYDIPFHS